MAGNFDFKEGGNVMLKFSDGMEFNTEGELRLECRSDGWYVVGQGMLMPVDSRQEGEEVIRELTGKKDRE